MIFEEVKQASNEQSIGIKEVSKAMEALNLVSNDTNSLSSDILKSSSTLGHQSGNLESVVKDLDQLLVGEEESASNIHALSTSHYDEEEEEQEDEQEPQQVS